MRNILIIERWRMGQHRVEDSFHEIAKAMGATVKLIQMMDYVAIVEDDGIHTVLKQRHTDEVVEKMFGDVL